MGCLIPNEYQEVEYIEGTGTQYIKTNYIPTIDDTRMVVDMMSLQTYTGDAMTLGSVKTNGSAYYLEHYTGTRFYAAIGLSRYQNIQWGGSNVTGNKIRVDMSTSEFKVTVLKRGVTYTSVPTAYYNSYDNESPVYLFAWNRDDKAQYLGKYTRIYLIEFYKGDVLTAKFIPCYRKSDNEIGMYDTVSKQFFTNQGTGTFLKGNDVYHSNVFDLLKTKKKIIMNQPHVETLTGDVVSFTTDMKAPLKECKVSFMPVQEGSGDPSPTNVRNITGWDGVEVYQSGKNLIPTTPLFGDRKYKPDGGTISNSVYICVYFPVPARKLYYKASKTKIASKGCLMDVPPKSGVPTYEIVTMTNYSEIMFDNSVGHKYFALFINIDTNELALAKLAEGNVRITIDGYASYISSNGATTPISWQSDYGTIYGGYVDLVSGELQLNYTYEEYTSADNWGVDSIGTSTVFQTKRKGISSGDVFYSNLITRVGSISASVNNVGYAGGTYLNVKMTSIQSLENFLALLENYPLQIVYKRKTPITYQLTPQQLITLKGQNNLWADTNGTTEIKFWKH